MQHHPFLLDICEGKIQKETREWSIINSSFFIFIYVAGSSISWGMLCCIVWDLALQPTDSGCGTQASELQGSGAAACGLGCSAACGILAHQWGTKPTFLYWRFLPTGLPEKSHITHSNSPCDVSCVLQMIIKEIHAHLDRTDKGWTRHCRCSYVCTHLCVEKVQMNLAW